VHFHVIPRYAGSRNFGALAFPDAGWPGQPALEPAVALDAPTIDGLVARLRAAWLAAPGP
jgi:diadenosine tetraphosphate (Ap4A) HIT family hydrolase